MINPPVRTTDQIKNDIIRYCERRLGHIVHRLFGYDINARVFEEESTRRKMSQTMIHDNKNNNNVLYTKQERGLREHIVSNEIRQVILEYLDMNHQQLSYLQDQHILTSMQESVIDYLFRKSMYMAAYYHGTRADGRGNPTHRNGWNTIRPIMIQVPALPDNVHGSALFARGDTQVLCTVTLGPPHNGLPNTDPYQPRINPHHIPNDHELLQKYPVGSLRFIRSQEAMISEHETRHSKTQMERTGDSGILSEVQNAFLHYDFPSYSTGSLPDPNNMNSSIRRSIGHGTLAERALLPVIPKKDVFPYTIRMTSEVTDSSGSSSMASICGTTLALLDAGVPIRTPVAGVSIGLAMNIHEHENDHVIKQHDDQHYHHDNDDPTTKTTATTHEGTYTLLMDITGTEDHVSSRLNIIMTKTNCVFVFLCFQK
jgi:polyribonucleotide nucleotidyltransferase